MMPDFKSERTNGRILERRFNSQALGNAYVLDAVREPDGDTSHARVFLKAGPNFETIAGVHALSPAVIHNIGGAPVIECPVGEEETTISVAIGGEAFEVPLVRHETELFAGLNVCLAVRNGETPKIAADWLRYHVEQQNMQGALIFDRAAPDEDHGFVDALAELIKDIPTLQRVVVLKADIPLGKEGLPAEAHPFNVPGAPGKDRMDIPSPDPWHAPLGEFLIYEIARSRFLSCARAVANIDLHDLIAPDDKANIFDRAVNATDGYIRLEGRQVYPWRVRTAQPVTYGDHICVPFDMTSERRRWCIAPGQQPGRTIWRLIRVVGVTPDSGETGKFFRCMALRHPTESVSTIVPKTSLVESKDLLTLSQEYFGHNPVRVPKEQLSSPISVHHKHATTSIVTTMKDEGPFILEWLAYHRMIGVDNFLIYTNDCSDGTDKMLKMLEEKGIVQHRENPFRESGLKPQHAALQAADEELVIQNSDWLVCMDVDEFINIKCGDGRLADLYEAVDDANMISMTWRLFGNSDVHDYTSDLITETFHRAAPELIRKPHQAWGFKTLFRNVGIFKKLGVHRPKGLKPQLRDEIRWVNGSGEPMPESEYRNGWRSSLDTYGYDLVQLNHYAVRSAESFLVKRDRGRVNHVERDQGLAYWFRMNNNGEEERSIQRMLPALRAELATLLVDPDIAAAHEYSVRCHSEKIAKLKQRPDMIELFDELTGHRLEQLSRMHAHFGANVFLSGPGVIPDEIAAKDPSEDFWFTVKRGETNH